MSRAAPETLAPDAVRHYQPPHAALPAASFEKASIWVSAVQEYAH